MKFEICYDATPIEVVQEIDHVLDGLGYTIKMRGTIEDDCVKFEIVKL